MKNTSPLTIAAIVGSALSASLFSGDALAAGIAGEVKSTAMEELTVTSKGINGLQGEAEAASIGTVLAEQLQFRPTMRPAEVLETIPGMVVTQHSGAGKANQYFLRGFNLDHGTDFANYVEGVPVNMVTHGHGQGYTDLNFLIPEMIDRMVYKKGPYYAEEGDFSSAGSAHIDYVTKLGEAGLGKNTLKVTAGEGNYQRALLSGSAAAHDDSLVYAMESLTNDGPWEVKDNFDKVNALLKYSRGDREQGQSLTGMYYKADWTGTDQVPVNLVHRGDLGRYGSLDETTGGDTHRYSVSGKAWGLLSDVTRFEAALYAADYGLNLSGNFTYFAGDQVNGDQVTQFDERNYYGGHYSITHDLNGKHELHAGVQFRYDDINNVGLGKSQAREIHDLVAQASVEELSYAAFSSVHSQWNDWFASIVGVRYQAFDVDVTDHLDSAKSGSEDSELVSPSLSLRFGPFEETEFFLNYGEGFHSNDARGVVGGSPQSADGSVPMMATTTGYELGMRTALVDDLQLTVVFFRLDLDSELVFVGDDGTTEPKGASTRMGVEMGAYYQPTDWFVLDVDFAVSEAKFQSMQYDDNEVAIGDYVPDSIDTVFSIGASFDFESGLYGGLRVRYFGPRKLDESGSVKSESTQLVNANAGYRFVNGVSLGAEVLNLFDAEDDDITYLYESQSSPTAPVYEGLHSHPVEPRTVRVTAAYDF